MPMDSHNQPPLAPEELRRYSRHITLPEVGLEGQVALRAASVLVVGTGGLGAPIALYLAAAGVGRLGLVDFDVVDPSNLQRQVLFGTGDIGRPKTEVAAERLRAINPHVDLVTHAERFTAANAMDLVRGYDVVVDGTDNFAARYLINDACVLQGKPNVYGSLYRFEGQVSVFSLPGGPCYRCLYPEPPPPGLVPSCAEGGVLGVLPGIVGAIQANETIKLIIGSGEVLAGRLLLFDALRMSFRELAVHKDPGCPACGEAPTIRGPAKTGEPCEPEPRREDAGVPEMEPFELRRRLDSGDPILVLDVRERHERGICDIGGLLIPMGELPVRIRELDSTRETVVYCRTGRRSAHVVGFLRQWGFENVWNLRGGLHAWSDLVDPTLPKY